MRPLYWVLPFVSQTFLRFIIVLPLLKFFARFQVRGLENLHLVSRGRGVIFAANHASEFDPPSITAGVPLLSAHTPMFFARDVKEFFARKDVFGLRAYIYRPTFFDILGAYPILKKEADFEKKLKYTIELLAEKRSVMLFPEGKRTKNGKIQEAKAGIGFLLHHTNATVIPVGIKGTYGIPSLDWPSFKKFFFRKHTISVTFGKPISRQDIFGDNKDPQFEDFQRGAALIMSHVEKLLR